MLNVIRKADEDDFEAICEIMEAFRSESNGGIFELSGETSVLVSQGVVASWMSGLYPGAVIICENENGVIGMVASGSIEPGEHKIAMDMVAYVKEEYRGQGISKSMHEFEVEVLSAIGFDSIVSIVKKDSVHAKILVNNGFELDSLCLVKKLQK